MSAVRVQASTTSQKTSPSTRGSCPSPAVAAASAASRWSIPSPIRPSRTRPMPIADSEWISSSLSPKARAISSACSACAIAVAGSCVRSASASAIQPRSAHGSSSRSASAASWSQPLAATALPNTEAYSRAMVTATRDAARDPRARRYPLYASSHAAIAPPGSSSHHRAVARASLASGGSAPAVPRASTVPAQSCDMNASRPAIRRSVVSIEPSWHAWAAVGRPSGVCHPRHRAERVCPKESTEPGAVPIAWVDPIPGIRIGLPD